MAMSRDISTGMLSLEEALSRITGHLTPLPSETVTLPRAIGRYTASTVTAQVDLPSFDNSAMDGYAVRASDVTSASLDSPVMLKKVGRIAAGQANCPALLSGQCIRLFTGSPLPAGADAVVMQEDTETLETLPDVVRVKDSVKPWENVRFRGEDIRSGATLLRQGDLVSAGVAGLLSATGIGTVDVHRRPKVSLIASGSELRDPGQTLPPGCIYESNRTALAGALSRLGIEAQQRALMPDTLEGTLSELKSAMETSDIVITTGGVSVGELDFLKPAFEGIGGKQEFWKIAIKPGKPFVFGRWNNTLWFGLPGNPVSAFVTFQLLVRPALLKQMGARSTSHPISWGHLVESLANRGDRRHFIRVQVDDQGRVRSSGTQASHFLGSLANANGMVDVGPGKTIEAGELVPVLRFD